MSCLAKPYKTKTMKVEYPEGVEIKNAEQKLKI